VTAVKCSAPGLAIRLLSSAGLTASAAGHAAEYRWPVLAAAADPPPLSAPTRPNAVAAAAIAATAAQRAFF
jgi:hypothetical protein